MVRYGFLALIAFAELLAIEVYGRVLERFFAGTHFTLPGDLTCFRGNAASALGMHANGFMNSSVSPYMYPPPFLLVAAPLAWLSPLAGYLLWSLLGVGGLIAAARLLRVHWAMAVLGVLAPPTLFCIIIGQNGAFTSSLLLISLGLAGSSPVLAGVAAGCMIIKPQLAILLPVCFLAQRNWRAMGAAAVTACGLVVLSAVIFGAASWSRFFDVEMGSAHALLDTPWPQPFQYVMVSPFITLRSLHAGIFAAYAGQFVVTVAAGVVVWRLWRGARDRMGAAVLPVTLCMFALATPYAYVYDLPCLGVALAAYAAARDERAMLPLMLFWFATALYILLSTAGVLPGAFLMLVLALLISGWETRLAQAAGGGWRGLRLGAGVRAEGGYLAEIGPSALEFTNRNSRQP